MANPDFQCPDSSVLDWIKKLHHQDKLSWPAGPELYLWDKGQYVIQPGPKIKSV